MVAGVFDELARERPRRRFTIGIDDDVSGTSLPYDASLDIEPRRHRPRGLLRPRRGRDGRREQEHDQDPRVRGATCTPRATSSTTRRSRARRPCRTCASGRSRSGRPTSCSSASFVGCHHFGLLDQVDVLGRAAPGATLLLNCRHAPDEVWDALPRPVQEQILAKGIDVYAIDAGRIAREVGLAGRINIVLQTCFFAISGVLPRDEAIARIKEAIAKTYGRRGAEVVERNQAAVDRALEGLHRIEVPDAGDGHARAAAAGARARAGVRPHRHRGDDGRPRRRPAGQRAAGGRHLPERHDGVREAQHLRAGRGLGLRPVHPVRQLQLRLPAQRDPLQVLRPVPAGGRAGGVPVGAAGGPRAPGQPLHAAGLRRGLHRLRAVRRGLPGRGAGRPGPQGDQPRASASRWSPPSATTSRSSRRCR